MLKSTSLIFETMRAMNILGILFGCYLLRNVFPFSSDTYLQYYREFSLILAGLGELDVKYFSWSTVPFP